MNEVRGITFRGMRAVLGLLAVLLAGGDAYGAERTEITWPYFHYPPYVILKGEEPSGIYWDIRMMLWEELVQYDHRRLESPFNRSYRTVVEEGGRYCFTGLLKRPDREEHLVYSLPVAIGGPHAVVCRKGELDRFKRDGKVSLGELLDQPDLLMSHVDGFSHGPIIDALLESREGIANVHLVKRLSPMSQEFQLVERGRTDYFVSHSFNSNYMYSESGIEGLEFIPITEDPAPFVSYVACTAGPWGEEVIQAVNEVVADQVMDEGYAEIFRPWLPKDLWPHFFEQFEALVREPARLYQSRN